MKEDNFLLSFLGTIAVALIIGLSLGFFVSWQTAGTKSEVWRRQGIEISQWEAFMGATPALVLKE